MRSSKSPRGATVGGDVKGTCLKWERFPPLNYNGDSAHLRVDGHHDKGATNQLKLHHCHIIRCDLPEKGSFVIHCVVELVLKSASKSCVMRSYLIPPMLSVVEVRVFNVALTLTTLGKPYGQCAPITTMIPFPTCQGPSR